MASIDSAFDRSSVAAWHDDINSGCVFNAAKARGVPAERVLFSPRSSLAPEQWLRVKIGRRRYMYRKAVMYFSQGPFGWRIRHINRRAPSITGSKHKTRLALEAAGVPVPRGRAFTGNEVDAALDYFRSLGREVCVKPDGGLAGDGIVPRIADPALFRSAFLRAAEGHGRVVVEESVSGEVIRYMVIGAEVVAVRLDRPASVVGDGARTIAELVAAKNEETREANLPVWGEIVLDDEAERILALSGLSLGSHLPLGKRAFLRATSNIPTGADGVGNPPGLHPSYAAATLKAVAAIPDLVLTAVDMMIADYRQPAAATNHWFLDLNSAPGIANFHFVREGQPSDVAGHVMDWLLAGGPR
jgi:D-alanine-D-alanine ligase-like ATP-grasp enzyme